MHCFLILYGRVSESWLRVVSCIILRVEVAFLLSRNFGPFNSAYTDLFNSWVLAEGSSSSSVGGAFAASCNSTYQVFLSLHPAVPHCISKFHPFFGVLDWPTTLRSLFFLPLDRQVIGKSLTGFCILRSVILLLDYLFL